MLGHALVVGTLRHLVTLDMRHNCLDAAYLDSDVYSWCTPVLENLYLFLGKSKDVTPGMLEQRTFLVNLPKLRSLYVFLSSNLAVRASWKTSRSL